MGRHFKTGWAHTTSFTMSPIVDYRYAKDDFSNNSLGFCLTIRLATTPMLGQGKKRLPCKVIICAVLHLWRMLVAMLHLGDNICRSREVLFRQE